jgi:hypothetical protein
VYIQTPQAACAWPHKPAQAPGSLPEGHCTGRRRVRGSLHTFARAPRRFLVVRAARDRCGARPWACLRRGAAVSGAARRRTARGGGVQASGERLAACAPAPAARAPVRCLSGRSRLAGAGWARLGAGPCGSARLFVAGAASVGEVGQAHFRRAFGVCALLLPRRARRSAVSRDACAVRARLVAPWAGFAERCDAGADYCV